jgi:hypothetical protein
VSWQFDEKKTKQILHNCVLKEKISLFIIEMHFVGLFYCVNDNSKINLDVFQMMCYLLCHSQLVISMNSRK